MIRYRNVTWSYLVCCVLFAPNLCSQLPNCKPVRNTFQVPSVPACRHFVKLLEDPQFCSLDQSQNCCVVLDAAVTNHCHCWQGFSTATVGLIKVLHKHCDENRIRDASQVSDIKVFIGILTGSANAVQRQAGNKCVAKSRLTPATE